MNIYQACVPTYRYYLTQLHELLVTAELQLGEKNIEEHELLGLSLHENMLPFGSQINVAVSFVIRSIFPLQGKPTPTLFYETKSLNAIKKNILDAIATLEKLGEHDFEIKELEEIELRAGESNHLIRLDKQSYLQIYAVPNFFFHWSMAYALLRQNGFDIGKNDFDGLHSFPKGFSFV